MLQSPDDNLSELNLHEGQTVADLGAGSGFHSIAAAKLVSPGIVYAVEIQKTLLDTIKSRAREEGVSNIKVIWGDIDTPGGIKLGDGMCDVVLIANTFFQVEDKKVCVREAKRILKSGGTLFILDWQSSFGHMGPHPEAVVTPEMARGYFTDEGFREVRVFDAGHHHWGIIFKKE